MNPEDIISKVIRGLDNPHYRVIKEMVEARDTPISFDAFHEKLINDDLRNPENTSTSSLPTTAFAAQCRGNHPRYPTRNNASPSLVKFDSHDSNTSSRDTTVCQYCGYKGHTFPICRNFNKAHPTFTLTPYSRPSRYPNNRPQAHSATVPAPSSPSWLVDSGATHHLTNDLSNLASHDPYEGFADIMIGDGSSIPISNIGYLDGSGPSPRTS
ncbi:hypothetical protein vseg_003813 [Gypsophila vaccaria]